MDTNKKQLRNYILLGLAFLVIPGSSFIMVGYGIKKFLDKRKAKNVQAEKSQEWIVPDTQNERPSIRGNSTIDIYPNRQDGSRPWSAENRSEYIRAARRRLRGF